MIDFSFRTVGNFFLKEFIVFFIKKLMIYSVVFVLIAFQNLALAETKNIQQIEFKGIPIGVNGVLSDVIKLCMVDESNAPSKYDKDGGCKLKKNDRNLFWLSYGNLGHELAWFDLSENGAVNKIEITADSRSLILLAGLLEEKYGKPKIDKETVRNGFGTEFENNTYAWVDVKGNMLIIEQMYSKVNEGRFRMISSEKFLQEAKDLTDMLKNSASNL